MKIKIKQCKETSFFYDIFIGLCFVIIMLLRVFSFKYSNYIAYLFFGIFTFISSFFSCKNLKDFLKIFIFVIISFFLYYISKSMIFFLVLFFAFSIRNNSFTHNVKIMFYSQLIFFIITVLSFFLFKHNYEYSLFPDANSTRGIRYSLGFLHPNNAATLFFNILLTYYLLHHLNLKNIVVSSFFSILVFLFTDSRTLLISIAFLFVVLIVAKCFKNVYKLYYYLNIVLFPLLTGIFILVSIYLYNTRLDNLASGRLYNTYLTLKMYSIPIFAQNNALPILDNLFVFSLLNKGIIIWSISAIFLGVGIYKSKKSYITKDFSKLMCVFIALMFFSLSEATVLYYLNSIITLITICLVSNHKEVEFNYSMLAAYFYKEKGEISFSFR